MDARQRVVGLESVGIGRDSGVGRVGPLESFIPGHASFLHCFRLANPE
jgi:hypothetical protein